jgi:hypothetical protein
VLIVIVKPSRKPSCKVDIAAQTSRRKSAGAQFGAAQLKFAASSMEPAPP